MKKIFLVLLAIAVISFFCLIQLHSASADEAKIFIGKVEKVTPLIGTPPTWTYNKIVVNDDKGTQETFFVMKATVITDVDGKDISGSGVTKDKKVEIKYLIITNGSSITNGQNGAISIRYVPLDYVQQPTVAQTTSKATEELQTFTGEVKIIEVKHFSQSEGLGLSQEFVNSFYDNLRERLAKGNVAGQIVDEGSATPPDLAANTIIIEGKFTEYKKGGFLEGVGMVGSEIKFYRKSDHALIKISTPRVPFKPSPLNSDNGLGRSTGYKTADEIKKELKLDYVQQPTTSMPPEKVTSGTTTQASNILIAQIEKVVPPDEARGVTSWAIIVNNSGNRILLSVTEGTVITDVDGKQLTGIPASLKKYWKVEVKYSISSNNAISIRYLRQEKR